MPFPFDVLNLSLFFVFACAIKNRLLKTGLVSNQRMVLPVSGLLAHSCLFGPPTCPSHSFLTQPCLQHTPSSPHHAQFPSVFPHGRQHSFPSFSTPVSGFLVVVVVVVVVAVVVVVVNTGISVGKSELSTGQSVGAAVVKSGFSVVKSGVSVKNISS